MALAAIHGTGTRILELQRKLRQRGYADSDIWNLDFFILSWLPEALDQLADTTFSFPGKVRKVHSKPR